MSLASTLGRASMLLVFVFGKVMTTSGLIRPDYKGMLLPGIIALAIADRIVIPAAVYLP